MLAFIKTGCTIPSFKQFVLSQECGAPMRIGNNSNS